MSIVVVGTNHKFSPIELRERIYFSRKRLKQALSFLMEKENIKEAVILSTCNRVEIYAACDKQQAAIEDIENFIWRYHEIKKSEFAPYLYSYIGEDAIRHIFLVTAGFDSMVLGESQIREQVKSAINEAGDFAGNELQGIFFDAVSFAEKLHKETGISQAGKSIPSQAIDFIREKTGSLKDKNILIIGVGKVTELILKNLNKERPILIFISNRTFKRAKELADSVGAKAIRFDGLKDALCNADILITATASPHPIIKKENFKEPLTKRLLIVDLSLPRNVESAVGEIENIKLYCLDDLKGEKDTGKIYRIGTRKSPLALKQADEAISLLKKYYPDIRYEVIGIDTFGDKDKTTPISDIEGTDFFTKEIDTALLNGEIDFAVHSAKDLPDELGEGLTVAAITSSIDPYDALVSKEGLTIDRLPPGAKIGTSSIRRKGQLKRYRADFDIVDIRGNIEERLNLLDRGAMDAIAIAAVGLVRLGLEKRITQRIPFNILRPHPLQGALAIIARKKDLELLQILSSIGLKENALAYVEKGISG